MTPQLKSTRAKSNCWTCKERKIGCDRVLPQCSNCARSKRVCKGYGLKLAWPDKLDGRRKQKNWKAAPDASATEYLTEAGEFTFLNTAFDDVERKRVEWSDLVLDGNGNGVGRKQIGLRGLEFVPKGLSIQSVLGRDAELLRYYDSVVARMITTIDDDTNGFRLHLIPMALSTSNASSKSLLEATLALSSFHIGRQDEALRHKVNAIKLLSSSFENAASSRIAQVSTGMMLCVYSVFDSSDTTWNVHLQGAKSLLRVFSKSEREDPTLAFVMPWLEYHDVFSAYSHPVQYLPAQQLSDIVLPEATPATQKIIGLLGCSSELLRIISCINQLRVVVTPSRNESPPSYKSIAEFVLIIREQLIDLKQEILVQPGERSSAISHARITLTAEFYRIAALLYLYQTALTWSRFVFEVQEFAQQGLIILNQMDVCTSPWPLFILACNVSGDADRIKVMRVIDDGAKERRVGNYQIIRSLVQKVWKQQDLAADEKVERKVDWRDLMEVGASMPSFI
ncbi:hypothetical protein CC80DRAFT_503054 [Byssothecium circinans]|uniref:Zn(2)-C6 fungal-type domain-containing protein n=1 Tax=Byssothecium circinans TaxID=147558 RepID=A0A6A5U048_9PLEO|nr:hypothetical protein CC80DRAFT_503054 [Byssothecium circinans]